MCGKEDANTGIHHLPSTGHGTISISYIQGRMAAQTNVQLHTYFIEMKYVAVCILYIMLQPILFYLQVLEDHEDDMLVSFMVKTGDLYYWPEPPDIDLQAKQDIVCRINSPELVNERAQFRFAKSDLTYIKECLANQKAVVYFK